MKIIMDIIKKWLKNPPVRATASVALIGLVVGGCVIVIKIYNDNDAKHPPQGTPVPNACVASPFENDNGMGFTRVLTGGARVGLSDGTLALDLNKDRNPKFTYLKCQGVQQFAHCLQSPGTLTCPDAENSLTEETKHLSDDAEALIYRQNIHIWAQSDFHFTFLVGVSLSSANLISSRFLLQGVYVAQEEYNRTHPDSRLRILIANFGDSDTTAISTLQQIIKAVTTDRTIIGIINIPSIASPSSQFKSLIEQLVSFNIPIIFPSGSTGSPNEQYSTMFHIAPSTWQEGSAGALFAQKILNAHSVVVFVDPDDFYSRGLACAFLQKFEYDLDGTGACDKTLLITTCKSICRYYTSNDSNNLHLKEAAKTPLNPDSNLIYFAGDSSHAQVLMQQLQNNQQFTQHPTLQIMGGDALYQPGAYDSSNYSHLAFTGYAFPDEWPQLNQLKRLQLEQPPFIDEYALDFEGWPPDKVYGFIRPNSTAILSYDATTLLSNALGGGNKPDIMPADVLQNVRNNPFQGFSGDIHFDVQGNPIQKATVFLKVNDEAETQMIGIHGCFRSTNNYCFSL